MSTSDTIDQPYEGQKFKSFDALKKYLEEYGQRNYVKFWIRSSHTRNSLKSKISKTMNPDLKYVCVKFACIFGGEKIRCRGSGIRKSSTYRDLGCPFMINAVVGDDGNHVKLDTVILEHNHVLCKTLYDSLKKTKRKSQAIKNNKEFLHTSSMSECKDLDLDPDNIGYMVFDDGLKEIPQSVNIGQVVYEDNQSDHHLLKVQQSKSTETCLNSIKDKYGENVKILLVNSEKSNAELDDLLRFAEIESDNLECDNIGEGKSEICRLCLSSKNKLSPIFNPDMPVKSTLLSFKIMGCASIEISSDDGLPNNICVTCEQDLDMAYKFRVRCENADSFLRKTYNGESPTLTAVRENPVPSSDDILLKNDVEDAPEDPDNGQNIIQEFIIKYQDGLTGDDSLRPDPDRTESNPAPAQDYTYVQFAISCPVCDSYHDTYESMLDHLQSHADHETLLLACNICNIMYTTVKELHEHMGSHLSDIRPESVACPRCEMVFATAEDLRAHEVESHATPVVGPTKKQSEVNYLCNVCGKILKTKDRFRSHRNTHEGLRPHVCLKCGRGFADRKNMHHHYNVVHLRKPKLECPVCQKKFYTRTKMKSHVTMHYGVKPFACDVCGKTFRLKMNMIKHKKTHSNDRPHKCDKCTAAFIDKNMLKRHSYIHGGVRPYPCPTCGHRFSVKFHLKKHLERSKCGTVPQTSEDCHGVIVADETYQWERLAQADGSLAGAESCLVVYKAAGHDAVLQETITMGMLEAYQDVPNS